MLASRLIGNLRLAPVHGLGEDTRYLTKGPPGTPSGFGFIKPDTGKTGEGGWNLRIDDSDFCCIHAQTYMHELMRVVFLSANSYTLACTHTCLTPSTLFLGLKF
jgi:hypothetical protein